jgi:signal transduction histidine kinase
VIQRVLVVDDEPLARERLAGLMRAVAPAAELRECGDGDDVRGSALVLTVSDNGPGLSAPSRRRGAGIGLANLRERLLRLYGEGASLVVEPAREGGCTATLTLPFRMAVAAA